MRRQNELRHWFGAAGRRATAQTDERLGPREGRGTLRVRMVRKGAMLGTGVGVVEVDREQGGPARDEKRVHQGAQGIP